MPTFRVYLSRPTTQPHLCDWPQTVVAPNAQTALGYAYANWQNSRPTSPLPPLNQCRSQVNPSALRNLFGAAAVSPSQQAFMDSLQATVNKTLSSQLDGPFTPVLYPSGFNYGITYGANAYYNPATLQDIDTLLGVASNGQPSLTGEGFSNLYAQIMQAVTFSFSQQDTATMNKQDAAASAQISAVLTEFTNVGGTFSSPLPVGGKIQDVFNQMTKAYGSLDKLPDTLNALRNAIASYKSLAGDSYALHNRYYAATARIAAAFANTVTPTAANGGQQVDASTYYVGFTPNKLMTANQLIGSLNTTSNAVSVQVNLSNFSSTSSQFSVSGGTSFSIPIADIIGISVSGGASYDLSRYTSASSSVTMSLTYPGVTLFASAPSVLSADNSTGWYANDILQEVAAKTGQDATGYQLQGQEYNVSELFGTSKVFSRLKTLVLSQQPTISMTFTSANANLVASDLQVNASVSLKLFGLFSLGSASSSYSVQKIDADTAAGSVTVTFAPPQISGTIPLQNQKAYVLGGVASYPPDSI